MSDNTHIEWTDATWNPITGCSVVSAGCKHCYAMKLAGTRLRNHPSREGLTMATSAGPVWNGQVRLNEAWIDQPERWTRPRRIFVCAHGDLFHESVPHEWIERIFTVMARCTHHTFQVLTKRPDRMLNFFMRVALVNAGPDLLAHAAGRWPLRNVWLGVSVEDQQAANERIPLLLQCPAVVRWVSAEPLLGPIDLREACWKHRWQDHDGVECCGLTRNLDWIVAGGESGPAARPMHPDWARSLRDQCAAARVPFLYKQWGEWAPWHAVGLAEGMERCVDGTDKRVHVARNGRTGGNPHLPGEVTMYRVGKKSAGRLLDGVLHDAYPA